MSATSARPRSRITLTIATLAAFAASAAGVLLGGSPAHADESTRIDSIEFRSSAFQDQSVQTLDVTWSAASSPASTPVRVDFALPPELVGQVASFDIGNGTCTVSAGMVECVIDDDYVEANPYNVHGSFEIGVRVDLENEEDLTGVTFTIGDVVTPPVDVSSRFCQTDCEFGGTGAWKGGGYDNATDTIGWTVQVPSLGEGIETAEDGISLAPGQVVTVTDTFEGNPFTIVSGPTVQVATCLVYDQWGYQSPVYTTLTSGVTVGAGNTSATFTTGTGGCSGEGTPLAGALYRVSWTVHADDGGLGVTGPGQYRNEATIDVGGTESQTAGTATRRTYGGTVTGESFFRFQLDKVFELGDYVTQPDSIAIDYTIDYPGDVPPSQTGHATLDASNGWSFVSEEIFVGSTVTISEANPGPDNVDWSFTLADADGTIVAEGEPGTDAYTFTGGTGGQVVGLTLTNAGEHAATQDLAIRKDLVNPDDVTIPDDTTFEVTASWPADPALAIEAGSETIELPADGDVVELPGVPVGAVVTFVETAPADIPGATWVGSSVSPETLTVGADSEGVVVTATNELERNVGSFTISKALEGDAAGLVLDRAFDVDYSWPANPELGIEEGSGTIEVTADGDPVTVEAPAGAEVTLSETLVEVEGGTWAQPVFEPGSTFTVEQDQDVAIALTNLIELDAGWFSIHKVVEGDAASEVPDGTEFTVQYSYPAGVGFEAGEGELTVVAGATATSPALPYGAVVTLTEATPDDVEDAEWSTPEFSSETIVIGDDTTVEVTLTNTITDTAVAPTPSPSDEPDDGSLPVTGADMTPWGIGAAGLLVAAGVLLTLVRSRRRREV